MAGPDAAFRSPVWKTVGVRVAVTGSHGLIGRSLVASLEADGVEVRRLVRQAPCHPNEVVWDPAGTSPPDEAVRGCDVVVHLAGAGIGDARWTPARRTLIRESRVGPTERLATAVARADPGPTGRPPALVSASAIGYYGERGDVELDEGASVGTGFLAEVCRDWEEATAPAAAAGRRVALARTGLVLSPDGGLLARLLPLARLGLLGPLGGGRQWMSWITLDDEVRALRHLIGSDLAGPVNLVGPDPVRNATFVRALARALRRPAFLPVPRLALEVVLGAEAARETALVSQRVRPRVLATSGFSFAHGDLDAALADLLASPSGRASPATR